MLPSTEIRQLLREARFALIRFEEDEDIEALEDAQSMLDDIHDLASEPDDTDGEIESAEPNPD